MKKKIIYSCIFVGIIVTLSIVFYFGMYLPKKARIAEQQKQETLVAPKFEESIRKDYKEVVYSKLGDKSDNEDILIGEYKLEINNSEKNTFSIFKDNELVSIHGSLDAITEVGSLKLNNTDYYLLQSYSGGAHCCFAWQTVTNENGALHIGEKVDLLHTGEQLGKYYFEKDGQLYFLMYDSSLTEFHTSFASSVFFPVFYRIDAKSANFVPVNNEFEKNYRQLAVDMDEKIEINKLNFKTKIDFGLANTDSSTDAIFSSLTYGLIIHILANQDIETAKKEFVDGCNFFFKDGIIEGEKAEDVADEIVSKFFQTSNLKDTIRPDESETIIPKSTLYWSNVLVDADGATYFVRRNMGKAGCEINSASKEIPDFCKSGPDSDLSECGSERNPSMATICELVAWKADGTQDFIADLLKIAPSQYNDLTVDLLGFSESGTVLIRYGNPWPHSSWFGIFTYDVSNRLRSKKPLVVWSGGYYNEWSVLEKGDYKLIFHPWIYEETSFSEEGIIYDRTSFSSEEGINDVGIYLIDHGKATKVNFPNYSFSQTSPDVEMIVADNWKPSSSVSFCFGKEKWSFNFETKLFSNLKEEDEFCER